mmetsp:Transcript_16059/g.30855  ORF Transcript_16059/g.30855 Transcript_16059/m.30855 type:complete len:582 (-) Transcript_16059:343-2088(-)
MESPIVRSSTIGKESMAVHATTTKYRPIAPRPSSSSESALVTVCAGNGKAKCDTVPSKSKTSLGCKGGVRKSGVCGNASLVVKLMAKQETSSLVRHVQMEDQRHITQPPTPETVPSGEHDVQRTSGATIRIAESAYASVGNEKLTVPGATPPCLNDQPIRKLDPPTRSNMQAGLIASETDLYVVDVAQLERAYAHASEAVLLTDDQHRLIWGNSVYHALVAMVDASHFMGHRPTPISLSLYRFRAPSGAECRSILWTFIHVSNAASASRDMLSTSVPMRTFPTYHMPHMMPLACSTLQASIPEKSASGPTPMTLSSPFEFQHGATGVKLCSQLQSSYIPDGSPTVAMCRGLRPTLACSGLSNVLSLPHPSSHISYETAEHGHRHMAENTKACRKNPQVSAVTRPEPLRPVATRATNLGVSSASDLHARRRPLFQPNGSFSLDVPSVSDGMQSPTGMIPPCFVALDVGVQRHQHLSQPHHVHHHSLAISSSPEKKGTGSVSSKIFRNASHLFVGYRSGDVQQHTGTYNIELDTDNSPVPYECFEEAGKRIRSRDRVVLLGEMCFPDEACSLRTHTGSIFCAS